MNDEEKILKIYDNAVLYWYNLTDCIRPNIPARCAEYYAQKMIDTMNELKAELKKLPHEE